MLAAQAPTLAVAHVDGRRPGRRRFQDSAGGVSKQGGGQAHEPPVIAVAQGIDQNRAWPLVDEGPPAFAYGLVSGVVVGLGDDPGGPRDRKSTRLELQS